MLMRLECVKKREVTAVWSGVGRESTDPELAQRGHLRSSAREMSGCGHDITARILISFER